MVFATGFEIDAGGNGLCGVPSAESDDGFVSSLSGFTETVSGVDSCLTGVASTSVAGAVDSAEATWPPISIDSTPSTCANFRISSNLRSVSNVSENNGKSSKLRTSSIFGSHSTTSPIDDNRDTINRAFKSASCNPGLNLILIKIPPESVGTATGFETATGIECVGGDTATGPLKSLSGMKSVFSDRDSNCCFSSDGSPSLAFPFRRRSINARK